MTSFQSFLAGVKILATMPGMSNKTIAAAMRQSHITDECDRCHQPCHDFFIKIEKDPKFLYTPIYLCHICNDKYWKIKHPWSNLLAKFGICTSAYKEHFLESL